MAMIMYTELQQSSRLSFLRKKEIYEAANFYVTLLLNLPFGYQATIFLPFLSGHRDGWNERKKKTTFDIYLKFIENKKFIRDSNKTFVSPMFEVYKWEVLIFQLT